MVGDGDWRVVIQVPVEGRVARFFFNVKTSAKKAKNGQQNY